MSHTDGCRSETSNDCNFLTVDQISFEKCRNANEDHSVYRVCSFKSFQIVSTEDKRVQVLVEN